MGGVALEQTAEGFSFTGNPPVLYTSTGNLFPCSSEKRVLSTLAHLPTARVTPCIPGKVLQKFSTKLVVWKPLPRHPKIYTATYTSFLSEAYFCCVG